LRVSGTWQPHGLLQYVLFYVLRCVAHGVRPFPCVPVPQHQSTRFASPGGRSFLSPFPPLSRSCHCRSSHRRRFAPPYCRLGVSVERRTGRRSLPVPLGCGTTWLDRQDLHSISQRPRVLSLPLLPFLPSSLALNGCLTVDRARVRCGSRASLSASAGHGADAPALLEA
jgi:hypothetical protein